MSFDLSSSSSSSDSSSLPIPSDNRVYSRQDYWDSRFAQETHYEWIADYSQVRQLILDAIEHNPHTATVARSSLRLLILGCGNSSLGLGLYSDGFINQVNLDYSSVLIDNQRKKYPSAQYPGLQWIVGDMTKLEVNWPWIDKEKERIKKNESASVDSASVPWYSEYFDVIIDKCALDALLVEEDDPWNPSPEIRIRVSATLQGVYHLLHPNHGLYLYISFGQPHFRIGHYLKHYPWNLTYKTFGTGLPYFFYEMRRIQGEKDQIIGMEMGMGRGNEPDEEERIKSELEKVKSQKELALKEAEDENHLLFTIGGEEDDDPRTNS